MRIPHTTTLSSAAPPNAVLAAIAAIADAGGRGARAMPDAFRRRRVLGIRASVDGTRFRLAYVLGRARYEPPHVSGRALPDGAGTRLVVRCARRRSGFVVPALLTAFVAWSLATRPGFPRTAIAVVLVAWAFAALRYTWLPARGADEARFLLDVLRRAIDAA